MAGSQPLLAPLLAIEALTVGFATEAGRVTAVDGIDLALPAGRTMGLVGESGSGKSVTALAIMGLLPASCAVSGVVRLAGEDLVNAGEARRTALRGDRMGMVFQEPMTALNPAMTIGTQVAETLRLHRGMGAREAAEAAEAMLSRVGIAAAKARAAAYPHHLSGGMRQRALIAMALICRPSLLIADEPTTALDVTVQAQILDLMLEMQDEIGMGILFISHDLGVISEVADAVAVMYAGRIVERGPADAIFRAPRHPYTQSLLAAVPVVGEAGAVPPSRFNVPGSSLAATDWPAVGCRFADRCAVVMPSCRVADPPPISVGDGHVVACLKAAP